MPTKPWLSSKEETAVEQLGLKRVRDLLSNDSRETITALIEKDKALAPEANAISSVDRLIRYYRDLHTILNNFVSFRDFYTPEAKAVFQAGTLYLDSRSCELCVKVNDVGKHSGLAQLSRTYLAYCDCTCKETDKKLSIAAAFTNGNADNLRVGRNGVFYDREGRDWDATIVKIVEHPISVRQAFWAPYKRVARMISEQIAKMSAAREKEIQTKAAKVVSETPKKAGPARALLSRPLTSPSLPGYSLPSVSPSAPLERRLLQWLQASWNSYGGKCRSQPSDSY